MEQNMGQYGNASTSGPSPLTEMEASGLFTVHRGGP